LGEFQNKTVKSSDESRAVHLCWWYGVVVVLEYKGLEIKKITVLEAQNSAQKIEAKLEGVMEQPGREGARKKTM